MRSNRFVGATVGATADQSALAATGTLAAGLSGAGSAKFAASTAYPWSSRCVDMTIPTDSDSILLEDATISGAAEAGGMVVLGVPQCTARITVASLVHSAGVLAAVDVKADRSWSVWINTADAGYASSAGILPAVGTPVTLRWAVKLGATANTSTMTVGIYAADGGALIDSHTWTNAQLQGGLTMYAQRVGVVDRSGFAGNTLRLYALRSWYGPGCGAAVIARSETELSPSSVPVWLREVSAAAGAAPGTPAGRLTALGDGSPSTTVTIPASGAIRYAMAPSLTGTVRRISLTGLSAASPTTITARLLRPNNVQVGATATLNVDTTPADAVASYDISGLTLADLEEIHLELAAA